MTTLKVCGQGVVLFKPLKKSTETSLSTVDAAVPSTVVPSTVGDFVPLQIAFSDPSKNHLLGIEIGERVTLYRIHKHKREVYHDPNNKSGIVSLKGAYYWVSIHARTQDIYVGVGEPRLETVIFNYRMTGEKPFLERLSKVLINGTTMRILKIIKDPITRFIPFVIKDTDQLTMSDIASSKYLPKANLSPVSQRLYDCISGARFVLDDLDFPDFSQAIEHSIVTPGLWCNTTLQNKSREFDPNKPNLLETYLRITLGENNGESPGIPYVMEIWPPGHYSPVHRHAGAEAIIRVLHGSIHVRLYPFLCHEKDGVAPFGKMDFHEGDITWINPSLNQTHQLKNKGNMTCVTIQCYMYDDENHKHYDFFDYLDGEGHKQQYEPDSDMDYLGFREIIKREWEERLGLNKM
jgi:quercetin dioxygenase-like cupin family protein